MNPNLQDVLIGQMSFTDWKAATLPKVQGTWNLHAALSCSDLDFFILCSSNNGIVGQRGQANYAAANTFLDAFVQYRQGRGQVASVIDIGVVGDIGFVSRHRDTLHLYEKSGIHMLKESDLLDAMNLAMHRSKPTQTRALGGACLSNPSQILVGFLTTLPISSPHNRVVWKRDPRASIYHNINNIADTSVETSQKEDSIAVLLRSAALQPAILQDESTTATIAKGITLAMTSFLIKEENSINAEDSPETVGVDSLVAIELRNWINQKFGVKANIMTISRSRSFLALGDHVRLALMERFGS
jgi:hypothetical protein